MSTHSAHPAIPTRLTEYSFENAAFYLTCASVVSILFSIAVSNILLVLAFAALLMSHQRMRFPPFWIPLLLFFAGTIVSLVLSTDPQAGRPAVRKFFVFLIVLVVYSTVRTLDRVRAVMVTAAGIMTFSALWSLVQFAQKVAQARDLGRQFYTYYVEERITGFMSHWMTIGGQEMIVLLMACSVLLFSTDRKWKPWLLAAIAVIAASLLAGFTRSIWFGTFCGLLYLIWFWRRWLLLLVPIPIVILLLANPFAIRDRVLSVFQPHGSTDSNQFRVIVRHAGIDMAKAHPWFGLGPEQVKAQLKDWIPPSVPRPLPAGWYGHVHNLYVQYAAERGIPTMLAFMWILGKILYDYIHALRRTGPRDGEVRAILHGAIAMMIGILAVAYYEVNLGDSEVLILFLSVVACGYVAIDNIGRVESASA